MGSWKLTWSEFHRSFSVWSFVFRLSVPPFKVICFNSWPPTSQGNLFRAAVKQGPHQIRKSPQHSPNVNHHPLHGTNGHHIYSNLCTTRIVFWRLTPSKQQTHENQSAGCTPGWLSITLCHVLDRWIQIHKRTQLGSHGQPWRSPQFH